MSQSDDPAHSPDTTNTPTNYKDLADIVEYLFPAGELIEDESGTGRAVGELIIHTGLRWDIETGRLRPIAQDF